MEKKTRSPKPRNPHPILPFLAIANEVSAAPKIRVPNLLDDEFRGPDTNQKWEIAIREAAKPLQGTLFHVPEAANASFGPGLTLNKYRFAEAVCSTLKQISRLKGSGKIPVNSTFFQAQSEFIEIDAQGRLTFGHPVLSSDYRSFRAALEQTNGKLIKACRRCEQLFLATRQDMQFCSSHCRQRKWCEEHPSLWSDIQIRHELNRARKESKY